MFRFAYIGLMQTLHACAAMTLLVKRLFPRSRGGIPSWPAAAVGFVGGRVRVTAGRALVGLVRNVVNEGYVAKVPYCGKRCSHGTSETCPTLVAVLPHYEFVRAPSLGDAGHFEGYFTNERFRIDGFLEPPVDTLRSQFHT